MTAPFGHTQGVYTPIGKCKNYADPNLERPCADIKNYGREKPSWTLPGGNPAIEPARTIGQSPAWPADGVSIDNKDNGKATAFPKCGKVFPIDAGIKALENQP
jgi:hypothetical protein